MMEAFSCIGVNNAAKLELAIKLITQGKYITINYPHQFGKTTTLLLLERELEKRDYLPISISFEGIGDVVFEDEKIFSRTFIRKISGEKRLDVAITFYNQKYISELKIWDGPQKHKQGIRQLTDYLKRQNVDKGYLVIFDFKKKMNSKQEKIIIDGKNIFVVWV